MSTEHTLAENLIRLQEAKEDIADAIVEMGGTASSTDGLEDMPYNIRTIQTGGGMSNFYGTCTTAADQQVKEVTISQDQNFELKTGVIVAVLFTNTNTYESTTENPIQLNINNTGNKTIKYSANNAGETNSATSYVYGYANRVVYYLYNGSYWLWLNHGVDANTTYSSMSASEANTGTSTTGRLISAKVLNDLIVSKVGAVKTGTVTYVTNSNWISFDSVSGQLDDGSIGGDYGLFAFGDNNIIVVYGNISLRGTKSTSVSISKGTTLATVSGLNIPSGKTANVFIIDQLIKNGTSGSSVSPAFYYDEGRIVDFTLDSSMNQITIKYNFSTNLSLSSSAYKFTVGLTGVIYFT